jgi:hypothetical protein
MLARRRRSSRMAPVLNALPQMRQTCCSMDTCDFSTMTISGCTGGLPGPAPAQPSGVATAARTQTLSPWRREGVVRSKGQQDCPRLARDIHLWQPKRKWRPAASLFAGYTAARSKGLRLERWRIAGARHRCRRRLNASRDSLAPPCAAKPRASPLRLTSVAVCETLPAPWSRLVAPRHRSCPPRPSPPSQGRFDVPCSRYSRSAVR